MSLVIADTITKLGTDSKDAVIVSGSHGGVYAAYLACKSGARAVILNDAGVGKDQAGIGSLDYCQKLGIAAATVAHSSARIGDAADMLDRGVISHSNALAQTLGCLPQMTCTDAVNCLRVAPLSTATPAIYKETRTVVSEASTNRQVICIDSASLVKPEDAGHIIITGSHGALLGNDIRKALQVDAFAAIFNDAGIGIENIGISRLPALEQRDIAAATVAAASARIGDACSSYYDGVLSAVNQTAQSLGGNIGMNTQQFVALLQKKNYQTSIP